MILDATTRSLQFVLFEAVGTLQLPVVVDYVDVTLTTFTAGCNPTVSNSTTPVTILAAPAASTQRQVKLINVYNQDNVAHNVTVTYNDNSTLRVLCSFFLPSGYNLQYTPEFGWKLNAPVATAVGGPGAACTVILNANQSIANGGGGQAITWNTTYTDNGPYWDAAFPTRLTVPRNGRYLVTASLMFLAAAGGYRGCWPIKNTATTFAIGQGAATGTTTNDSNATFSIVIELVAGDYIEVWGYQNRGSALNAGGSTSYIYSYASIMELVTPASPDGWTAWNATWTYASATTFTVPGDQTANFAIGDRIRLTQTTPKYFYVVGASYSAPNTTVTVAAGSDYSLANAAITSPSSSKLVMPDGFPQWFNYTPVITGFSSAPTLSVYRFSMVGRTVTVTGAQGTTSTSNSTSFSLTAPFTARSITNMAWVGSPCRGTDNGATVGPIFSVIAAGFNSIEFRNGFTAAAASWTSTGSKSVSQFNIAFEI